MRNIRFGVEYDGTDFAGWQRQPGGKVTVQGVLEGVLSQILQERVNLAAAGRTDRGVHARHQVVSLVTGSAMDAGRLVHSVNALLPHSVRVFDGEVVPEGFHARHSARRREYRYRLLNRRSALEGRFAGFVPGVVDRGALDVVAKLVVGEHDFSAFCRQQRDDRDARVCRVAWCGWRAEGEVLVLDVAADRFLRSMVRYLVDAMVRVGQGRLEVDVVRRMLDGVTGLAQLTPAPASGLFLWRVGYD